MLAELDVLAMVVVGADLLFFRCCVVDRLIADIGIMPAFALVPVLFLRGR